MHTETHSLGTQDAVQWLRSQWLCRVMLPWRVRRMKPDAAHGSRLVSITYPDGTAVEYTYGNAGSLNDVISRLNQLSRGTLTLESYKYLGLSTVVERSQGSGLRLTYLGTAMGSDSGDKYSGLDRFGRVIDQRWQVPSGGAGWSDVDRYQYSYDRDSNVTSKINVNHTANNETYTYDGLNRLTAADRAGGTASDQSFGLDSVGNISYVLTGGATDSRTSNSLNQLTQTGSHSLTYDATGNMTTDDLGRTLVYDTWNRLVAVTEADGTLVKAYCYDGLGRRTQEITVDTTGTMHTTDLYYSASWQVLEELQDGNETVRNTWSPVYVNALLTREDDTDADGTPDRTLHATQDATFNVIRITSDFRARPCRRKRF